MARLAAGGVTQRDDLAVAIRKAEPYLAACYSLVGSVAGFTFLGYWLDRWMGHSVRWLLVVGSVFGMVVGFVCFFSGIARAGRLAGRDVSRASRAMERQLMQPERFRAGVPRRAAPVSRAP